MVLQWFPGHMAKTRRLITDSLKLVDVVIELVDARLPLSSRNPEIDKIVGKRPRVLVLNKADIADSDSNEKWLSFFRNKGISAILMDSQSGKALKIWITLSKKCLPKSLSAKDKKVCRKELYE